MTIPTPRRGGFFAVAAPPSPRNGNGGRMSETEHEHDGDDEAVSAPVSAETVLDEEAHEEEAHEAEQAAEEPAEAPEAQGPTPEQWEKRFSSAERSFGTYTRRVTDLWEEDATELVPFIFSPSAPAGFIDKRDAGRVPDDAKRILLEWLGYAQEQDYNADPQARACDICGGKGLVRTGSLVAGNETRKCAACAGFGYVPPPTSSQNGTSTTLDLHAPAGERVEALSSGDVDMWGEPLILPDGRPNPNHGKLPDHKVPVSPWGVTAGLTAQDVAV